MVSLLFFFSSPAFKLGPWRNQAPSFPEITASFFFPCSYLGEVDVGDDDDVDGAGGVPGVLGGVAARVVAVLALGCARLPGHALAGDADLGLRGGLCGGGACVFGRARLVNA